MQNVHLYPTICIRLYMLSGCAMVCLVCIIIFICEKGFDHSRCITAIKEQNIEM